MPGGAVIFEAKPPDSTGPCEADDTCANPEEVCQKSDGFCYPPDAPGLDSSSTETSSEEKDKKKKKGRKCVDRVNPRTGISDCRRLSYLCENTRYYQLMTQECAATCRRRSKCTKKQRQRNRSLCVDRAYFVRTLRPACPSYRAYCRSRRYFGFMRRSCAWTCGFC
ncbi:hypothetical protein M3Y99_01582800 [Aphelenchoides fujianensis]|nr:hypothetical protein M3Y99_01582800 [Aphelenchoides fujianensis]